jgi:murein DD-endopeptidase MepM/ murein hydrolase activator NlpD
LLNASVGVQRVLGRFRRPPADAASSASTLQVRSLVAARRVQTGWRSAVTASRVASRGDRRISAIALVLSDRRALISRLGPDRTVAVAAAGILLGASLFSLSAAAPAPATGGPTGPGTDVRIAIGGADSGHGGTITEGQPPIGDTFSGQGPGTDPAAGGIDEAAGVDPGSATEAAASDNPNLVEGPFLDDGTLLKPVAVNTTVADGRGLVQTYKVQAGDTLTGIAAKFGISMMTIWWANDLKSKDDLHIGQELSIPPVTGLVVTVTADDTLDSLAQRYEVDPADILIENQLTDPNLVVGQVLVIPGAAGKGIPTPKPVAAPVNGGSSGGGSDRGSAQSPSTYSGGTFRWPVVGGGNYISQYFHYGHYGLDIAGDYGAEVRAAGGGTVIFAGYKGNGGGYQVWISHGSNLYTTYNHLSAISVGYGQSVSGSQQVGRIGQSGNATGAHLHFEVWRGPVWDGGTRLNPLGFL